MSRNETYEHPSESRTGRAIRRAILAALVAFCWTIQGCSGGGGSKGSSTPPPPPPPPPSATAALPNGAGMTPPAAQAPQVQIVRVPVDRPVIVERPARDSSASTGDDTRDAGLGASTGGLDADPPAGARVVETPLDLRGKSSS